MRHGHVWWETLWRWLIKEVDRLQMETHDVYHFNTMDPIDTWIKNKYKEFEELWRTTPNPAETLGISLKGE